MNANLTAEAIDLPELDLIDEVDIWDAVNDSFVIEVYAGLDVEPCRREAHAEEVLRAA